MPRSIGVASFQQFLRFAFVGALGFCVDATVIYLALFLLHMGPYAGRLLSYFCAASSTWYLNRTLTFADTRSRHKAREWLEYLASQTIGGVINYGAFAAYLAVAPESVFTPAIGVGLGACAGLVVNYALSRRLVFRHGTTRS